MNFCIERYLRIKSSPINAIWFIKTNFLEGIKYLRLSIGAIVLFEVFTLASSQNWKKATRGLPLTQFRVAFDVSVENSSKKRNVWKGIRLFSWLETSRRKFGFLVYALHILSTLRGLVKYTVDRNNGWSLQYLCLLIKRHQQKPRYSSVYPRQMSGAVLWNSLPIYWPAAGEVSWGFEGRLQTILLEIYTVLT